MGYELRRMPRGASALGRNPFRDMRALTKAGQSPIVFDVGANLGQSIEEFRRYFARPTIHSFEPSPGTFEELRRRSAGVPDLKLNNAALGSRAESRTFLENKCPDMSSFLEPSVDCWGAIEQRRPVEVWTLDDYCDREGVDRIDILKSDTQGYDLEVLRGAEAMIRRQAIHLIYMEIIFSDMYKGLPRLDEIYGFLADRGFALVSFYAFQFQKDRASWTDALFVHPGFPGGKDTSPG
jgi:FkbM family methyltransferase